MFASVRFTLALCVIAASLIGPAAGQDGKDEYQSPAGRGPLGRQQPTPTAPQLTGADFYLVNRTQLPITSIEASRPEDPSWGVNRIGATPLAPGARFLVAFPKDGKCQTDLRVYFQGGNVFEHRSIDTCKLSEYRMDTTGAPPVAAAPATASVTIVNAFRLPVQELRLKLSSSAAWGVDRLGTEVIAPRGQWVFNTPRDRGCQYDLLATFEGASDQEIPNINVCTTPTVTISGPRRGTVAGFGSGFRISSAGHVMTNNHVVRNCGSVAILAGQTRFPLQLIGQDPAADLAVLKQPDVITAFLSFRNPDAPVRLAERAISIGYPIPGELSGRVVTEGIVNALTGRRGRVTEFQMQTPIQPGNSGGPVFDRSGLVIGISVAGITQSGDRAIQNVNFAIHPGLAARFAESLGVQVRFEPGIRELSTADVMDRNADRVLMLACVN